MYEFRDLKPTTEQRVWLPSVAMNFNGTYIEHEIEGYQTLKVAGRETIGVELMSEETHEGTITVNDRLPHRELRITYKMESESNTALQDDFKHLRKVLTSNEEVPIRFHDEPDTVYFGRLSAMETVPDDKNNIISTFNIHCDSPYKFGELMVTNGNVTADTFYKTSPEKITVDINETVNKLEITNSNQRITATGTFNAGAEVAIYFEKEEVRMTVNDVEATYMIDLQSDLENFLLKEGQTITSPQGSVEVEMRERWL